MEIQSVHRQSFGRIIAPEKYIGQQIAKIKDEKGRQIARGIMHIVKQSDVVDIFVSKKGQTTVRTDTKKITRLAKLIARPRKSEKIVSPQNRSNFLAALVRAVCIDSTAFRYSPLPRGVYSLHFRLNDYDSKYKSFNDLMKYGIDNLIKTR